MIKKIRQFLMVSSAGLAIIFSGLALPVTGGIAAAAVGDIQDQVCAGVNAAAGTTCGTGTSSSSGDLSSNLTALAKSITKWFSIIVGAASVIMIIYGGFRYITSGGDSNRVGAAKNTLIYAIIGLIIVALAQVIVRVVITQSNTTTSGF